MDGMTGTCKFCGQTRIVPFNCTQAEADVYAAENCSCDNSLKKCRHLRENIDTLCGKSANSLAWISSRRKLSRLSRTSARSVYTATSEAPRSR